VCRGARRGIGKVIMRGVVNMRRINMWVICRKESFISPIVAVLFFITLLFFTDGAVLGMDAVLSHGDRLEILEAAKPFTEEDNILSKGADWISPTEWGADAKVKSESSVEVEVITAAQSVGAERTDLSAKLLIASEYLRGGNYYSAIKVYRRLLAKEPRSYRIMNELAFLYIKLQRWEEAMDFSSRGLEIEAEYAPLLINAGIASIELGRPEDGESFFLRAFHGKGEERLAAQNLALLYESRYERVKAARYYAILERLGLSAGRRGLRRPAAGRR